MHLNYHYFKFLCPALEEKIKNTALIACFSQNKEELVMEFSSPETTSFFIRALLLPANTCLSFPEDFRRSKKNSVDLFPDIIGKNIKEIRLLTFERAFYLLFDSGHALLFKMHGNRSNLLLYPTINAPALSVFKKELKEDLNIVIGELNKPLDLSEERFLELEGNASQFLPTLGKLPRAWLKENGYLEANPKERYLLIKTVIDLLESPLFSVFKLDQKYHFTLLPCEKALASTTDPIAAANTFYRYAVVTGTFEDLRGNVLKSLSDQIKKTESYITKTNEKLLSLENEPPPSQTADVIMANLHQLPKGVEKVELFDFYLNENREFIIKRGLTPQKHAENLYRKSKNRKIEIDQLRNNLASKENLFLELSTQLEEIQGIEDFKTLKNTLKSEKIHSGKKDSLAPVPYKKFEFEGFDILVGKSSKGNDELLRRFTWKDDLWLHAKDVSGSHVIIKQQSGMVISKTVLERAAELAAYYSKNRSEQHAPVIYTPSKYVRKVKGSPAGAVMVDREKVIMVTPKGPQDK